MRNLGCVFVVLVACGGGGSETPPDKCDDLVDLVCDRAVDCVPSAGTHAQCVADVSTALDCDAAVDVTASYASCMSQLRTTTCGSLFPNDMLSLPADCNGVILIGE
ncbi:MAG: hypothetical protein ACKV2T_07370 [Kofleriaceae bacterium]